jgi:hypothetical protein
LIALVGLFPSDCRGRFRDIITAEAGGAVAAVGVPAVGVMRTAAVGVEAMGVMRMAAVGVAAMGVLRTAAVGVAAMGVMRMAAVGVAAERVAAVLVMSPRETRKSARGGCVSGVHGDDSKGYRDSTAAAPAAASAIHGDDANSRSRCVCTNASPNTAGADTLVDRDAEMASRTPCTAAAGVAARTVASWQRRTNVGPGIMAHKKRRPNKPTCPTVYGRAGMPFTVETPLMSPTCTMLVKAALRLTIK